MRNEHAPVRGSVSRGAFTLVEILAVVIILGIASALIIPQLSSRDDLKAASAARLIMADLIYAQNQSIAMQRMHYVKFDIEGRSYTILDSMSPERPITHPVTKESAFVTRFQQGPGLRDVALVSATFNGYPVLAFDELGTPHYYNGAATAPATVSEIVIRSGVHKLSVAVEPYTGEVHVR
jgi:prepilin-type N-terminal cleavage/methylation domain-containing protein